MVTEYKCSEAKHSSLTHAYKEQEGGVYVLEKINQNAEQQIKKYSFFFFTPCGKNNKIFQDFTWYTLYLNRVNYRIWFAIYNYHGKYPIIRNEINFEFFANCNTSVSIFFFRIFFDNS